MGKLKRLRMKMVLGIRVGRLAASPTFIQLSLRQRRALAKNGLRKAMI
jgi:hypothetical protein